VLKPIQCVGLNPYKIVEMYKNYRPNVPVEYHSGVIYAEPSEEVWLKVKVEKREIGVLGEPESKKSMQGRRKFKAWHSAMVRLRCRRVVFFSR
jgi:hypothetical protein